MPGSPFHPTIIDSSAVRIIGGWDQYLDDLGRIQLPVKMAFDITNAGPGVLECKIGNRKVNPEKTGSKIRFDIHPEGLNAGEHNFEVKFGNVQLMDCPKYVISPGDQVILTGKGLSHAECGEATVFTIDGSKAGPGNYKNKL